MNKPIKLETGGVYVIHCERALSAEQKNALISQLDQTGCKFILLDYGLKLACSISTEALSFEQIEKLVSELKK